MPQQGSLDAHSQAPNRSRAARLVTWTCAGIVGMVGAQALLSHLLRPEGTLPQVARSRPNTALALLLLGSALCTLQGTGAARTVPRRFPALAICAVVALSLTSFLKQTFGLDLGLHGVLAPRGTDLLMSPVTATALMAVSGALLLFMRDVRDSMVYHGLIAFTALLALVPLVGHLYGAPTLYRVGTVTPVAMGTALSLLLLALALMALRSDEGLWKLWVGESAGSMVARRVLPIMVLLPIALGYLRVTANELTEAQVDIQTAVHASLSAVVFGALLVWAALRLHAEDMARRAVSARLQEAHATLELRVQERTRALSESESEVRRAAARYLSAKESAEQAMRARTEFLARMSHEMRTPLNGVVGMLDIALRSELTPAQRDYVQTARSSADALLLLINEILDFSKMDAGKLLLESMPFRLRDCLASALRESAPLAHQKGLTLALAVEPDVPESRVGDPQRLRQVVSNLVSNAVKFSERGQVTLHLTKSASDPQAVNIAVSDTGVGIAPEKQQEIFQAFAQADESTTRRFGGTGLGLAISAQLVQLMGGHLAVESEVGQGSRFFFSLTLPVDSEAESVRYRPLDLLAGRRVLVVEPEPAQREFLLQLLTGWGMDSVLVEVSDLPSTLRAGLSHQGFSLVLASDQALALNELPVSWLSPERRDGLPLVLLTRATPSDDAREERLMLASAQLMEPVVPTDLYETLAGLLAEAKVPEQLLRSAGEHHLRVLLAEDNEVNRRVACFVLEDAGFNVVAVCNGREALAALREQPFDVVLMDGHMPEMDGIEATRQLRAREQGSGRHTPVVALTAQAMKGDRERYLAAGMDAYLTKPLDATALVQTIRELTAAGGALRGARPSSEAGASLLSRKQSAPVVSAEAGEEPVQERTGSRQSSGAPSTTPTAEPAPLDVLPEPPANDVARRPARQLTARVYERDQLLRRLRGQVSTLRTMVQIFDEDLPELLSTLRAHLQALEAQEVERAAHKLAGALLTIGAEQAARSARLLEQSARRGELTQLASLFEQLEQQLNVLRQALLAAGDLANARTAL